MKDKILIILPSRSNGNGREHNVERFIEYWRSNTEGYSDLCILLDEDDEHRYKRHTDIQYFIRPNVRFVPKINAAALEFKTTYKYIANFSDDFIIRNKWESLFITFFENNNGVGIAYGNDLLQQDRLPTAVCMTSNIVDALGYFVPPQLQHMYADNFWKDIGAGVGILKYFPDIIFEHVHPDAGKATRDPQYIHAASVAHQDEVAYGNYLREGYRQDIEKLKKII